jgi:hypothetical protein
MIEWESGEIITETLAIMAAADPVTCAIYAREHGLLDKPGWKRFKNIAKHKKQFTCQVNQVRLRSFNTINMVLKFQGHMIMLCGLIKRLGTPYGETPHVY